MSNKLRLTGCLLLVALCVVAAGCDSDFYLSESEVAAYANILRTEQDANSLVDTLTSQPLDITFNTNSTPPTINHTNLLAIMRSTELGLVEGWNRQVRLDRLSEQLERQLERWIQRSLVLAEGSGDGMARLARLNGIRVRFINNPTFHYDANRRAIAIDLRIQLEINGAIEVNVHNWLLNVVYGVNGTYPLQVIMDDLRLTGEARFENSFADSSELAFALTPRLGGIRIANTGPPTAPGRVIDGVRTGMADQLSQVLRHTFTQRYDHFALANLGFINSPPVLDVTYLERPATARSNLHFIARGSDGRLHHQHKLGGGRGALDEQPFPSLKTRIESDPAVFASGRDKLELAATTVNGDLIYAHWRDVAWTNQHVNQPASAAATAGYRGKPAIVASAPGQIEIIAEGRNNQLWHVRRFNGEWSVAAISIPSAPGMVAPYRSPAAVISGNKVVVSFLDSSRHMFLIVYDLEARMWGQATSLSSQTTNFPPALAVTGSGSAAAVFLDQNGVPCYRALRIQSGKFIPNAGQTGISLDNNEVRIGGNLTAAPVLLCTSEGQLELIGRDTNNRLTHNHFVGPNSPVGFNDGRTVVRGWQGWGDLNGNFSGTRPFSDGRVDSFAAVASLTGKVELAARISPSVLDKDPQQFLLHNSYDSGRYGMRPWNTVHWRGYEQVGEQRFLGQPAVAATDGNYALAFVGGSLTLLGSRMAETSLASFSNYGTTQIVNQPVAVDPVLVSSAPGFLEILLVGVDGRLRHVRQKVDGGNTSAARLLPSPPGVTFRAPPAVVAYGSGFLEVVAVGSNNGLYHWRYQNEIWSSATQVQGSIISAPVLAHLGGGQLLLLGVGGDQKLYLWYFSNGAWSNWRVAAPGLVVNQLKFGQLSVSSWGDGSLDVAVVEEPSGALYHGRLGPRDYTTVRLLSSPTPSLAFSRVGGNLTETPILTAFDPTRINVLAIGTDMGVYSAWAGNRPVTIIAVNQAPPIVWSGYQYLGRDHLLLSAAVKTGRGGLAVAGVDRTGLLWISQNAGNSPGSGGNWSDFHQVVGQPTTNVLRGSLYRPAAVNLGP